VLVSAGLFGASFPPRRLQALAWLALVPLFLALRGASLAARCGLGALFGVAAAWSVGDWMPRAIERYYLQPWSVGFAFFVGIALAMAAPYFAAFGAAYGRLARTRDGGARAYQPLLVAAAWVGCELARGRLWNGSPFWIGNPWALAGYSQAGVLPAMQIAAFTGVYGVSFCIAACAAGIAEALVAVASGRRGAGGLLLAGALPGLAAVGFGALSLRGAAASPAAEALPVVLVQGNVYVGAQWRAEDYGRNLDVYLDESRRALAEAPAATVFWPESALSLFLEDEAAYRAAIARALGGAELVVGGPRRSGSPESPRYTNSVFVLEPSGEIAGAVEKELLVPFGEYFPLRSVAWLRRRFESVRSFSPGSAAAPLATRLGPVAVAICSEALLPEVVNARAGAAAAALLNPSNDAWIPEPRFAEHLLDVATFRAVEQGKPLLRVSTTGPSAIVEASGRVAARSAIGERTHLAGRVVPRRGATVYGRVGDAFALGCAAAAALALVLSAAGPPARAPSTSLRG
jgi:apolipoprotein N-acyltransferase